MLIDNIHSGNYTLYYTPFYIRFVVSPGEIRTKEGEFIIDNKIYSFIIKYIDKAKYFLVMYGDRAEEKCIIDYIDREQGNILLSFIPLGEKEKWLMEKMGS